MYVRHLSLADYRSYHTAELALGPGTTLLVGSNGQGKTNLVEALGYLATLSSHRVSSDTPLVRSGAGSATVRAAVVNGARELVVELQLNPGRANRARLGGNAARRPRDILGVLHTVLFAPEDIALVRGDPGERRRFLDELLVQRHPRIAAVRQDYERILKQRNALLKSAAGAMRSNRSIDLSTLDVWDAQLAAAGSQLLAARLQLCEELQPHLAESYAGIAGSGSATLLYHSTAEPEDLEEPAPEAGLSRLPRGAAQLEAALARALAGAREQELQRGITLVGPHRDDLVLMLGDLRAKGYASHGESWSYALALRLACYELLRSEGVEPVLILDDVFAELDARRRSQLADRVASAEQLLITAAVAEDVPASLSGSWFEVSLGQVSHVG